MLRVALSGRPSRPFPIPIPTVVSRQGSGKINVNILNIFMIIQYFYLVIRAGQNSHVIINLLRLFLPQFTNEESMGWR